MSVWRRGMPPPNSSSKLSIPVSKHCFRPLLSILGTREEEGKDPASPAGGSLGWGERSRDLGSYISPNTEGIPRCRDSTGPPSGRHLDDRAQELAGSRRSTEPKVGSR